MFDSTASLKATAAFTAVDDAGVVDAITTTARAQNAMCGRELAAIGELELIRETRANDPAIGYNRLPRYVP